ncbi:DUF1905 domain-containing protein [Deinococcus sp. NW-56]|uniref:DUF1905 domain-containing protein n=1 Tax=Deinococcus sp. NW-56 TaxID=2080419 RepID=UPI000CF534EE
MGQCTPGPRRRAAPRQPPAHPAQLGRTVSPKGAPHLVTSGWGMLPVRAQIGSTRWKPSLFPQGALYLLPVRASVRPAEGLNEGDLVAVRREVG